MPGKETLATQRLERSWILASIGSTKIIFKHSDWLTRSVRLILPGEWQGPALGESLPASPVGCLTIFFERRLAAIGAIDDYLIAPSAFYEVKGGLISTLPNF